MELPAVPASIVSWLRAGYPNDLLTDDAIERVRKILHDAGWPQQSPETP